MNKNRIISFLVVLGALTGQIAYGQQVIPFTSDQWDINAEISEVKTYKGVESLHMKNGLAILKNTEFLNGIIEFDIAVSDKRGFMGVFWRMQSPGNYEQFYIRPHQSGNVDANQYNPVFNASASWQLYHGEGYGAPVHYKFDDWMHIKVVVAGDRGEVFITDMEKPALVFHSLKRPVKEGRIGLSVANFVPAYFANFKFTPLNSPELTGKAKPKTEFESGTVRAWKVSNAFNEDIIKRSGPLDAKTKNLNWSTLKAETTGLVNLARIGEIRKGNTVFAKLIIDSDKDAIREIQLWIQ